MGEEMKQEMYTKLTYTKIAEEVRAIVRKRGGGELTGTQVLETSEQLSQLRASDRT